MSEAFATAWNAIPQLTGYWYLSSPYSGYTGGDYRTGQLAHRQGRYAAYLLACRHAAEMMHRGHVVYSPIAHSHPIQAHTGLPAGDQAFWRRQWEPLLRGADGLAVLMLPGWRESEGVTAERALADGPPITVYLEPIRGAAPAPPIDPQQGW